MCGLQSVCDFFYVEFFSKGYVSYQNCLGMYRLETVLRKQKKEIFYLSPFCELTLFNK